MRIANHEGRLAVVTGPAGRELAHDVEKHSNGRFGPGPQAVYEDWDAFTSWADSARLEGGVPIRPESLGSPAPAPRQVFGIGLNYRDHAAESGLPVPDGDPPVFTKFPSCITGPHGDIELPPGGHTDWEVELVAVVGRRAHRVPAARALEHVAGYAVGPGYFRTGLAARRPAAAVQPGQVAPRLRAGRPLEGAQGLFSWGPPRHRRSCTPTISPP